MAYRSNTPPRRSPGTLPTVLSVALVVVLLIGAGALSWLAIERAKTPPPLETSRITPSPTVTRSPSPSVTPTPQPVPTPTVTVAAASGPDARFLASSNATLWRATAGACGTVEPVLERSTDAGRTWTDVTPRYRQIGQILGLAGYADGQAQLIALMGAECALQGLRTFTNGQFWEPNAEILAGGTYLDPASPGTVVDPAGSRPAPCTAPAAARGSVQLRGSQPATAVICAADVSVSVNGAAWTPVAASGVVAVAVKPGGAAATLQADAPDCAGLFYSDDDLSYCFADVPAGGPAALALDASDSPWVWAGEVVATIP